MDYAWQMLAKMLTVIIVVAFYFFKEIFIIIGSAIYETFILLGAFFKWIVKKIRELSSKKKANDILEEPQEEVWVKKKEIPDLAGIDLKNKLNLYRREMYDGLVEESIKWRGIDYYVKGYVRNFKNDGDSYEGVVKGTKDYNVSIKMVSNTMNVEAASCDCPYFARDNKYCKHIYAVLCKIVDKKNEEIIIAEINKDIEAIREMNRRVKEYLDDNMGHFPVEDVKEYLEDVNRYDREIEKILEKLKMSLTTNKMIDKLEEVINIFDILREEIKDLLDMEETEETEYSDDDELDDMEEDTDSGVLDVVAGLSLADSIGNRSNRRNHRDKRQEEEMDNYYLDDWQKDLVRKGDYDPWDFEEDGEHDEDDYYSEDED